MFFAPAPINRSCIKGLSSTMEQTRELSFNCYNRELTRMTLLKSLSMLLVGFSFLAGSHLMAEIKEDNDLLGTWKTLTTQFVESQGYSLVGPPVGEIRIRRDAANRLIASGSFSVKTRDSFGTVSETKGQFTDCVLESSYVPSNRGIIDNASPNRFRVMGNFSDAAGPLPPRKVATAQLFFSNGGMLTIQCGGGQFMGFDRVYFVRK